MEAFPGPIGYEPVKEGGSGADDFGHHVVLRFGARQIHEPDPLYGIFSPQGFGDAPALGISLHENIETLAGLLYTFLMRQSVPPLLTACGIALLVVGVVIAVRAKPEKPLVVPASEG